MERFHSAGVGHVSSIVIPLSKVHAPWHMRLQLARDSQATPQAVTSVPSCDLSLQLYAQCSWAIPSLDWRLEVESVSAGEIANVRLAVSQRRMAVLVACVVATLRVESRVQGISTPRRRTYTAVEKW